MQPVTTCGAKRPTPILAALTFAGTRAPKEARVMTRLYAPALAHTHSHPHPKLPRSTHMHTHTQDACHGACLEHRGRGRLHPRTSRGAHARSHNKVLVQGTPLLVTAASCHQAAYGKHTGSPSRVGSCTPKRATCLQITKCMGSPQTTKANTHTHRQTHRNAEC